MQRSDNVVVVDDDAGVRKALARLLRTAGYEVTTFASADEYLASAGTAGTGCLLLDMAMPGIDGLALQQKLAEAGSCAAIVFISGASDIPKSVRAMKAGAIDFLTKPFDDEQLLEVINAALRAGNSALLARDERRQLNERLKTLTSREREVFEHVVSGQLNKRIATDLGIVEKTIKVHRARVMHKMGAASLADLVRMAARLGIRPGSSSPES